MTKAPVFWSCFPTGSAMMELVYDIASGANFKFNTAFGGIQVRFAPAVIYVSGQDSVFSSYRSLCRLYAIRCPPDSDYRFR